MLYRKRDQTLLVDDETAALNPSLSLTHTHTHRFTQCTIYCKEVHYSSQQFTYFFGYRPNRCAATLLVVESATVILNLITGLPEIYVHSVEIVTEDCRVVGVRLLAAASHIAPKFC
jgi:hypothetical protein